MLELQAKVKYTHKQKERLILALAYINTHRKEWKQEVWRCGTGMCLAGHLAVTLNPSRPVAPIQDILRSDEIKRKGQRTGFENLPDADIEFMHMVDSVADRLIATKNDNPQEIGSSDYNGKTVETVPLRSRAESLIGELSSVRIWTSDDTRTLFSGENKYSDLVKIAAAGLDMSTTDLKKEISDVIIHQGWHKAKA